LALNFGVTVHAKCLKVLKSVYDCRVELTFGHRLNVVRLKVLMAAAPGTLPPIPLKRQNAIGEFP
jgi:hypothetical protein